MNLKLLKFSAVLAVAATTAMVGNDVLADEYPSKQLKWSPTPGTAEVQM